MNKLNFKLKEEIFSTPNRDKDKPWNESWSMETHGMDVLKHPFKCLVTGKPGSGKSCVIMNCFLRIQLTDRPFKQLIIIQPGTSSEWDVADPTLILSDIPDAESLVESAEHKKTLIIIDDFDLTALNKIQQKNLSLLFRYISSHCNISIFMSYQSFFDVPTLVRKCCNYFIVYKTNNVDEISTIAKRTGYTAKVFQRIFSQHILGKHDFLLIDNVSDYPLRKNIYEIINYDDYK